MGLLDWIRQKLGGASAAQQQDPETVNTPPEGSVEAQADSSEEPEPPVKAKPKAKKTKKPSRKERLGAAGDAPKPPRKKKKNKKKRKHLHADALDQPAKPKPVLVSRAEPAPAPAPAPFPEPAPAPEPVPEPEAAPPSPPPPEAAAVSAEPPRRPRREDTRSWIVVPKLEALLEEAESVLSTTEPAHGTLKRALGHLEREWRRLAPVPREHADRLEPAYQSCRDRLSAKLASVPDPREAEEAKQLAAREALIAEARALLGGDDVRAMIDRARVLQKEWRAAGRVPKAAREDLNVRWKAAMDDVYARRDADRAERLRQLEQLTTQAERLIKLSDPVRAADAMKGLQDRWKAVRGVRGEASDALWARFRGAADQIFEKRRAAQAVRHQQNRDAKEALIAKVTAMAEEGVSDPEETRRQLMRKWKRIGHVAREDSDALWAAFREACDRLGDSPEGRRAEMAPAESLRFNPFADLKRD